MSAPERPTCPSCTFWDSGARRRRAESPEHAEYRPCLHPRPDAVVGPQEVITRTGRLLTGPQASCRSHPARGQA